MGATCAAKLCKNKSYNCKKSFFRFPTDIARFIIPKDANIRQIWIQRICNVKLSPSSDTYLKNHPVCKSHFVDCCTEDSGRLRRHSLPTLNLPGYNKWLTEVNCFFYPKNDDSYITPEKVREICQISPTQHSTAISSTSKEISPVLELLKKPGRVYRRTKRTVLTPALQPDQLGSPTAGISECATIGYIWARTWVISCGREELLGKLDVLHKGYVLCQDHFEVKMFTNQHRCNLNPNAVPTLFPALEGSSRGASHLLDHSYTPAYELEAQPVPKINVLQDLIISPGSIQSPEYFTTANTSLEGGILPELPNPTSSTQTTSDLSYDTPRKRKYRETINILRSENVSLKKRVHELKHKFAYIENFLSIEQFHNITYELCGNDDIARFVNSQVGQADKKPQGRRYSYEFKLECLSFYFTGPKMYKQILMKKYCLPTPTTLLKLIKEVKVSSGLHNPQLYEILQRKVNCFDDNSKYCIICIDEMSIKSHLFYNRQTDCVIGLSEGEGGADILKPALNASVIMVRGIFSQWKQPVAFNFCHSAYPALLLKEQIFELIKILTKIGLKICAVTTDMGSDYMPLSNLLGVTATTPYFFCEGQKVFYIFDVPHIIKAIRNMLLKYDFLIDNDKISWSFIKMFYEHDKNFPLRAAPKLTTSHINPNSFEKMKTKYATQLFSETVACGMNVYIRFGQLPSQAYKTSEFVSKTDKVFDILNSSCTTSPKLYNRAFKGLQHQEQILKEFLILVDKIVVKDKMGKNIKNKIKSFKCIKISINSILMLWEDLKEKKNTY